MNNIFKNIGKTKLYSQRHYDDTDTKPPVVKKPVQITPAKYQQLESIVTLTIMIVMFVVGYIILYHANIKIFYYLLSANFLIVANIILAKLK